MYLSNIVIKNYRSIKELSLTFKKGKNIIVGKNNSGKSNIIKAIDIILGESSPTWSKSDNITDNDFYNGNIKEPIYIFCQLRRDENEQLDYEELNKCFGFKCHSTVKYSKNNEFHRHKFVNSDIKSLITSLDEKFQINENDEDVFSTYINPKLQNQCSFKSVLDDKYHFAYGFKAYKLPNDKIHKEIRFFFRENKESSWIMAFSAPIRTEFLQSAIINSFRDPQNELRINQWSWFGKLLREYIKSDNEKLKKAFSELKLASNDVFSELETEINNPKVQVAFPNTKISFQFNPDTKLDIYKSALIYVDDGFNSLLQEKGSGIQSAVVIGLYNYYTNYIANLSSSLLVVEEPEIYLHPQARRVISNRIDDFLQGDKNQVIITTHSTEFISSAHENLNIIVTKKNDNGTTARNANFDDSKDKQILVKSQNAEMFFADKVILVEGGDKYIVESLSHYFGKVLMTEIGSNWLNDLNISVISVGGKSEFSKYVKKLNQLEIPVFVLADFDFFLRGLSEYITCLDLKKFLAKDLNAIKSKLSVNQIVFSKKVLEFITDFSNKISSEGFKVDEKEVRKSIKDNFRAKKISHMPVESHTIIRNFLKLLKKYNVFILENELEDYYTDLCKANIKNINGKEERPIYIVSQLVNEHTPINSLIIETEFVDFFPFVIAH